MPPIVHGHSRRRGIWCFRVLERKKIRDWLKSISAYANTEGGSLFFGVQNDGTVVGLDNPQSVADFIVSLAGMVVSGKEKLLWQN